MAVRSPRRGFRWMAGGAAATLAAMVLVPLFGGAPAGATSVSPTDPFYGFPASYADDTGLRVAPCITPGMCSVAPPDPARPASVPDNFPDAGVYASASTRVRAGSLDLFYLASLDFAFAGETPPAIDQQIVWGRVRIRVKGLVPGAQYTITHPYGVLTVPADAGGTITTTSDVGCAVAPCDFGLALRSPVAQHFLQWDTGAPAGYLGDPASPHAVTGSPNGTNFVELDGLNAGGIGVNTLRTDTFVVEGKIATTPFARPGAVQSLRAVGGPAGQQITLQWNDPASTGGAITGYAISRSLDGTTWSALTTTAAVNTFTDTGLGDRRQAFYRIAAQNPAGQGPWSAVVSASTFGQPSAPLRPTAQPGLRASDITVGWEPPADTGGAPVLRYTIVRTRNGVDWDPAGTVDAPGTQFVDHNVSESTRYRYAIAAINAAGEGPRSELVAVTSFGRPGAPQSLQANPGPAAHEVSVSWSAPAADGGTAVTGYRVERATGDGPFTTISDALDAGTFTFVDDSVAEHTAYRFRVAAINLVGAGPAAPAVSVTSFGRPVAPAHVTAKSGPLPQQITVAWNAPADDGGTPVTGYTIFRRDAQSGWTKIGDVHGDVRTYTDTIPTLAVAQPFRYAIVATNIVGDSDLSLSEGCSAPFPWVDTDVTNALICE